MRKKKIFIVLIFIMSCCYFLNATYAVKEGNVYLSANQEKIEKEEEVEIAVKIENAKTAAFDLSLSFDETKLEYISVMENTNRIGNQIHFVWFDEKGGEGAKKDELVKFKFKAKKEGLATFSVQGNFYGINGQEIQTNFNEIQVQIGKEESVLERQIEEELGSDVENDNANLQALRLNYEGLIPNFDKEIQEYYLTIPNSIQELEVLAISENPKASIKITGNKELKEGLNHLTIQVESASKEQSKVYTIHVTKTSNLELANSNLEILAIENVLLNSPFEASIMNYKAEIPNSIESINIFAVPENEQATVEISKEDNLKEGNNLVSIITTAPNGFTKKKYQVEIYRRNVEEENQYQEEQLKKKEELENAYKVEQTSSDNNKSETKNLPNIWIWVTIIGVIVIFAVFGVIWKRRKSD